MGLQRLESGALLTLDGDPQMIWENGEGAVLRTVRMEAAFDRSPGRCAFTYTTKEGEPFSVNKRVFAAQADDGSYLYTLPQGRIAALRLDPCSPEENKPVEMTIAGLYVNEPAPGGAILPRAGRACFHGAVPGPCRGGDKPCARRLDVV